MNQRRSFLSMEKIDIPHNKATNNLQNNTELNYKSGLNEDVSMLELKKPSKAKLEECITLEHLKFIKEAFGHSEDKDNQRTLCFEEFKNIFLCYHDMHLSTDEHDVAALFIKIDASSNGRISWEDFCAYMQLEYTIKETLYSVSKETSFLLPAVIESSPHRSTVLRVTNTCDNTVLSIGQDGLVSFWDSNLVFKRTKQIQCGTGKKKWITDFILMPQYNKFIISTGDREIQFHELSTFEEYCQICGLETIPLHLDYCFIDANECILLYGDDEGCISIFIIRNASETLRLWKKMPKIDGFPSITLSGLTISKNITFIRWKVHNNWVQALKYYHSIQCVVSCSSDSQNSLVIGQVNGSTNILNCGKDNSRGSHKTMYLKNAVVKRRLPSDETVFKVSKGVKVFDFCKTMNLIITGGMDRLIRLWNPYMPAKPIGILRGHVTPLYFLYICENDNKLFSISNDKVIKVWEIQDEVCLSTIQPKSHLIKGDLTAVHYNPISMGLVLATDHIISFLQLKNKTINTQICSSHKEGVTCFCYNSSYGHVVTASERSVIKIWDIKTGKKLFEFSKAHNEFPITSMELDSANMRLITGGWDGKVKIWNYNNGHCLNELKTDVSTEISCLEYFTINKKKYIASVGWDRKVNLFLEDKNYLHQLKNCHDDIPSRGHKEDILCVAFCQPHFLATSSYDGEVIIWNIISGLIFSRLNAVRNDIKECSNELLEGHLAVSKLLFLAKRSNLRHAASLVTNGPKGLIHFWNILDTRVPYAAFKTKNEKHSTFIETSSDNNLLLTADDTGFLYVWDIQNYCMSGNTDECPKVLTSWQAHFQVITCICWIEEHSNLITSSLDTTVKLWTSKGILIGTFGQLDQWNINSLKDHFFSVLPPNDVTPSKLDISVSNESYHLQDGIKEMIGSMANQADVVAESLATNPEECLNFTSIKLPDKRLRRPKDQAFAKITTKATGVCIESVSAYRSLKYYELEDVRLPPET